jgi:hypothetical protein
VRRDRLVECGVGRLGRRQCVDGVAVATCVNRRSTCPVPSSPNAPTCKREFPFGADTLPATHFHHPGAQSTGHIQAEVSSVTDVAVYPIPGFRTQPSPSPTVRRHRAVRFDPNEDSHETAHVPR